MSPVAVDTTTPAPFKPKAAPFTTTSTDPKHIALLADLERDGYAVIKGAIPKERADQYVSACYDWLESFNLGFKRDDPSTISVDTLPVGSVSGLYHNYGIAHEKFVWDIRSEPGVIDAFAQVYGTQELLVSYDGINVTFPNRTDIGENLAWPHQDQDPEKPGFRCLQGIVNLLPNGPNDGGLLVCKGAYKASEEFHEHFKNEPKKKFWTTDWYGFSEQGLEWLKNKGYEWVKVCAEPGDLIVWDSRAPHYNCSPTGEGAKTRMATYTCYLPKAWGTQAEIDRKALAFQQKETSTHWPLGAHFHAKMGAIRNGAPDPHDRAMPLTEAVLNDRAMKLTGVVPY